MFDVSREEITEGPLLPALLTLAAPLLVQNLVMVGQQVVDLFWLGRLSGAAVSAVGLSFPVIGLLFSLTLFGPLIGTQVLVSQRVGGGSPEGARAAAATGLAIAGVIGVVVGAIVFFLIPFLVDLLTVADPSASGEFRGLAITYLRVFALGLAAVTLADTLEAAFVGWGDSRASLYINLVTVAVNIVLDPLLIFGLYGFPELAIAGAALATVISSVAGLVFGLALVARGRNDGMLSRAALPSIADARELLDIGLPTAGQGAARQVASLVVVVIVFAASGAAALAAYLLGVRVSTVAFVPAQSLQQSAASVVGQNLGAGHTDRASRTTWVGVAVAGGTLTVIGAAQWLVPGAIVETIAPTLSPDAKALGVDFLRILAYGYPAIGAAYLLEAGFNAARQTRTSMVSTLVQFWAVRIPFALVVAVWLAYGAAGVFWAITVSNIAAAVWLAAYYRYSVDDGMLSRAAEQATA
jgi:putative MATE family efflux protein